ncbi:MAG: transcription-repair coupling factor, partial [Symploca sp. SIO1B1]|nr:transcription-repair coupling factor [Symploca sp. SIO1B1]
MAFSSTIRAIEQSLLTSELLSKLNSQQSLHLNGVPRLPKGLVASALAKATGRNLFVVSSTLEEASRWATQLEAMDWKTVHLYPTSEASPYEPFDPESEMTWGQMQVLADLVTSNLGIEPTPNPSQEGDREQNPPPTHPKRGVGNNKQQTTNNQQQTTNNKQPIAIVATQIALQPHLPTVAAFKPYCLTLNQGMNWDSKNLDKQLVRLGYERVPLVEIEGQWSRRGDIVDIFP